MLVSAVGKQQHACMSTQLQWLHMGGAAAAQLHPTAVHPRGQPSIPRPRGTSDAIAHQPVGLLLPDKDSSTLRDQGSETSAVITRLACIEDMLCDPLNNPSYVLAQPCNSVFTGCGLLHAHMCLNNGATLPWSGAGCCDQGLHGGTAVTRVRAAVAPAVE